MQLNNEWNYMIRIVMKEENGRIVVFTFGRHSTHLCYVHSNLKTKNKTKLSLKIRIRPTCTVQKHNVRKAESHDKVTF